MTISALSHSRRMIHLRRHYSALLPLPCWRCGETIRPGDLWDVGHIVPLVLGGSDADTWPEHRNRTAHCFGNQPSGRRLAHTRKRLARHGLPSRVW